MYKDFHLKYIFLVRIIKKIKFLNRYIRLLYQPNMVHLYNKRIHWSKTKEMDSFKISRQIWKYAGIKLWKSVQWEQTCSCGQTDRQTWRS